MLPSIGRDSSYNLENEINLFEHFKLRANLLVEKSYNEFEWLVLAQHHTLPTRLLDWTSNPLVAAFFSVKDSIGTGRVYSIKPQANAFIDLYKIRSPFEVKTIKFLMPPVTTKRIELQRGLFSLHPLPNRPALIFSSGYMMESEFSHKYHSTFGNNIPNLDKYSGNALDYQENYYEQNRASQIVFDIPNDCKVFFEKNIRALGIDENLYGDLDAIANSLKYQLKNKHLHSVAKPLFSSAFAIWEKILEQQLIDLFHKQPQIFIDQSNFIVCKRDFFVSIDMFEEINFNQKVISGNLSFTIAPNVLEQPIFFVEDYCLDSEKYKKIEMACNNFLSSSYNFFRYGGHCNLRFKAELLFGGSCEHVVITHFNLKRQWEEMNHINGLIKQCQELIQAYKLRLSSFTSEDLFIFNNCKINSSEFIAVIEKYKKTTVNVD